MSKPKSKAKIKAVAVPVPQSDADAEGYIVRLGEAMRKHDELAIARDKAIASATETFANTASIFALDIERLAKGLAIYCAANRQRLTDDGKVKTAKFATGTVEWRSRPPSVHLKGKVATILERVKELGLADDFIRTKEELNKSAMLDDPETAETVKGVRVMSVGEDFAIRPVGADREVVEGV